MEIRNYQKHDYSVCLLYDGKYGLDILMENCDSDLVRIELDASNMMVVDVDPIGYLKKYAGRCPIFHLKDHISGKKRGSTVLGEGELDIPKVIETGPTAGVSWMVVEQEFVGEGKDDSDYRTSDLECAKKSIEVLRRKGFMG